MPETLYTCRAKSVNAAGSTTASDTQIFTTLDSEMPQQVAVQDAETMSWWPILTGIIVFLLLLFGWLWQKRRKPKGNKSQTKA